VEKKWSIVRVAKHEGKELTKTPRIDCATGPVHLREPGGTRRITTIPSQRQWRKKILIKGSRSQEGCKRNRATLMGWEFFPEVHNSQPAREGPRKRASSCCLWINSEIRKKKNMRSIEGNRRAPKKSAPSAATFSRQRKAAEKNATSSERRDNEPSGKGKCRAPPLVQ